jgi:hypothetical protein
MFAALIVAGSQTVADGDTALRGRLVHWNDGCRYERHGEDPNQHHPPPKSGSAHMALADRRESHRQTGILKVTGANNQPIADRCGLV